MTQQTTDLKARGWRCRLESRPIPLASGTMRIYVVRDADAHQITAGTYRYAWGAWAEASRRDRAKEWAESENLRQAHRLAREQDQDRRQDQLRRGDLPYGWR